MIPAVFTMLFSIIAFLLAWKIQYTPFMVADSIIFAIGIALFIIDWRLERKW